MKSSARKILVTGAGGFVGSHLTESLVEDGADVSAFIHYSSTRSRGWLEGSPYKDNIHFHYGDIRDLESVVKACKGIDVIFHLAALIAIPYSYDCPRSYVDTNINGTLNILTAARLNEVSRIIHTSTSEVYGTARYVPIDELHALNAQSPYSASKIGADKIVEAFHLSFGLPVVTVRPFNTYGPRQSNRAIIPTIITQALAQDEIKLGSLAPTRDLTFVQDTVKGIIAASKSLKAIGETINLSSNYEVSIEKLSGLILEIIGKNIPVAIDSQRIRPQKSEVDRLWGCNKKAKDLLSWVPVYSLEDGIKETLLWMSQHQNQYRINEYVL